MSAKNRDSGVVLRSCWWAFSLLALLGLAACGASDQGSSGAIRADPRATEATAADVSQPTIGVPQQPIAATLDTSAKNVQPTEAAKPAPAKKPAAKPKATKPSGTTMARELAAVKAMKEAAPAS